LLRYVQTSKQILIEKFGCKDISTDKKKSVLESPNGTKCVILPNGDVEVTTSEGVKITKFKEVKKQHISGI
jgi:hypothetical protein